jgi:hypothetical protein
MPKEETRGEGNAQAKISEMTVRWIRQKIEEGRLSPGAIAKAAGISVSQVLRIKTGECWRHVT